MTSCKQCEVGIDPDRMSGLCDKCIDLERARNARQINKMHPGNRLRLMMGQPLITENKMTPIQSTFIHAFNQIADDANFNARKKGWWDNKESLVKIASDHSVELGEFALKTIAAMDVALIQSEASEALENIRHNFEPDDKIPEFTGEEAEYADVIIRIMDIAAHRRLRVAEALVAKMEMNKTRAHKHGGKAI